MKRTILLLLPVIALAATGADGDRKSREEKLGELWQEALDKGSGGETAEAMLLASRYVKEGGDAYLATLQAAWLNYNEKKFDDATKHYTSAARLQPGAVSPRLGLLNIADAKSDVAGALKAGELVLAVEPTNYRALYAVAWGSFQAKKYSAAASAYRRILSLYPEDKGALSGTAWAAYYQGQKTGAKQIFRKLISIDPDYQYARQGLEACGY
ncbi:MAG: tetratricopeptide repeat protein [Akkermansiaceae bacterium]|nr:tetratricopeptide repeat protein [Akkermansiaceae bacterium]MCF7732638.1 tetratricopeptide repeat protein [Akkermansiaceae bacterium]